MNRSTLLTLDGLINLLLGILLIFFPAQLVAALGLPEAQPAFYASILGGVLFGVGMALMLERFRRGETAKGLGLGGAISINLCGALVLAAWLLRGGLGLPTHGYVLLWSLVLLLVVISAVELVAGRGATAIDTSHG